MELPTPKFIARDMDGTLKAYGDMPVLLPTIGEWCLVGGFVIGFTSNDFFPQVKPGECMKLVAVPLEGAV